MSTSPFYANSADGATPSDPPSAASFQPDLSTEGHDDPAAAGLSERGEPRSGEGAQPPLGNIAKEFGKPGGRGLADRWGDGSRADRYVIRDLLRGITRDQRLKGCGAWSIRMFGSIDIRRTEVVKQTPDGPQVQTVVGCSGLNSCARWYSCPFCAAKIAARRRDEIERGVAAAVSQGLVAMVTLTVRHKMSDPLVTLLEGLRSGWTAAGQDKAVRRLRRALGWVGYVRALEVTYGPSGWHPHYHFIVFFDPAEAEVEWPDGEIDEDLLDALGQATLRSWKAGVVRVGLGSPNRHGYDLKVLAGPTAEVAEYLTKSTLGRRVGAGGVRPVAKTAHEMTGAMTKQGKRLPSGRKLRMTSWDVVARAAADSTEYLVNGVVSENVERFWELEEAMRGRAMTVWSKGLRKRFDVDDVSDEDVVREALSGPESTVIGLPSEGVRRTQGKQLWHALLGSVLKHEKAGGVAFCDEREIDWLPPDHPTLIVDRQYRRWMGQRGYWEAQDAVEQIWQERADAAAAATQTGPPSGVADDGDRLPKNPHEKDENNGR